MQELIFIVHVLAAISLIALVLMQQGKGADAGAAMGGGGASQTVFGSVGSVSFLVKVTALVAGIFFMTSLALNYMSSQSLRHSSEFSIPTPMTPAAPVTQSAPVAPAPAVVPESQKSESNKTETE